MKKILLLMICLLAVFLSAEEWKIEGTTGVTLNQNYYSDNWNGEENGSVSWMAYVDMLADKQINPKFLNKNKMRLEFGQTHSQNSDTDNWDKPEKTSDKIDIESLGLFTLGAFVDPFVGFKFESAFLDESVDDDTKMINPITLTESFGASKTIFKNEMQEMNTRLGGAFKQNLNSHDSIDNTNNGGLEFVADYKTSWMEKRADFKSSLILYQALYYSEEDSDPDDNWKAMDVNWENTLAIKLNSILTANFYTQLIYDKEISYKGQLKQTSGLGLSYKFM
jgi:hypothetical protein